MSDTVDGARLSFAQRALFSLLTTALVLMAVEVGARWVVPPPPPPIGQFAEVDPFVPDPVDPAYLVTQPGLTDAEGGWDVLRPQRFARHKAAGTVRVLLVGGSSVFQLQENIPAIREQLAAALGLSAAQVEVVNGGGNGQGSAGVRHVVEFMLDKDVDAVVVYSAHNEYTQHLVRWGDGASWTARVERFSAAVRGAQVLADMARLAWVRRSGDAPSTATTDGVRQGGHASAALEVLGESGRQAVAPDEVTRRYQENLTALVEEARARGVVVVLATVPSNLLAPAWCKTAPETVASFEALRREGKLAEAAAFADDVLARGCHFQSTHVENDVIRSLVAGHEVYLADVLAAVCAATPHGVCGEALFMDHCHLDDAGRQIWVATVVPALVRALESR